MAGKLFNMLTGKGEPSTTNKPVLEVKEPVQYSEDLLDDYYSRRQDWADIAKKNIEYRHNNQLSADIRDRMKNLNQSPVTFNRIHPNVELAKQFLTHKDPQFQASAREDSDVQMARAVTMILSYIWDNSDGNIEFARSVDEFYVGGVGCLFAFKDPSGDAGRGEVKIKSVDPFKVYIDPNSEDPYSRDAAHIIISDTMTAEQVQDNFSAFDENILDKAQVVSGDDRRPVMDRNHPENPDVGQVKTDTERDYYEVIDRYSKVKSDRFHVAEGPTGKEFTFTSEGFTDYKTGPVAIVITGPEGQQEENIIIDPKAIEEITKTIRATGPVFHYVLQRDVGPNGQPVQVPVIASGEPGPESIPGSRTEIEFTNKGEVIDDIAEVRRTKLDRVKRILSVGRVLIAEEELEISEYPIVPAFNNHSRNPYPLSDVYHVRGLQDALNKVMSDIMAHLANSKSARVLVPRGSDRDEIERIFRQAGVGIAEYEPDIGTPVVVSPTPLPNEVYAISNEIEKKIQDQFGIYGVSAGDPASAPRTFNATLMLDENAQRRMGPKIKNLYGQLNVLADVVLQYAQNTYDRDKIGRILQPNFDQLPIEINHDAFFQFKDQVLEHFDDFAVTNYDVKIVSGSTLPNNRWARMEYYIKLYQMGIIDDVTVLRNSDIAEVEEVLNRKSQLAQAKNMIGQLQEQIKNMKGDMQTLQRETTNARQQKELQKTKSKLKELEVKAEADLKDFKQNLDRDLKSREKDGANSGREAENSLSPF